ncbi:MAG: glutamate--cysteine ligase [Pseudomonadales bacterium]|nr:glutamate--cysteine ligase [Pseudomonadales bacterium]MCP5329394.1 glutamate--cysteine ligase [Pseudomonadales bacterium]MCP5344684.1 glutamate--cysteine ligase [Pseudomonadales bacterium]
MTHTQQDSLARFGLPEFPPAWGQIRRGIEKESLRVTHQGYLAQTPHPSCLGSTLTHPHITTDYSEALLELITPVSTSIEGTLSFLHDLHTYTYSVLPQGERLWVSSMPCLVESDEQIPLARYGSSNIGRLKTLYREGLGHRYGRAMQTIAGIHYNFSMPEEFWPQYHEIRQSPLDLPSFQTQQYLALIRNFHRHSWLLPYLFGASPAVSKCFTQGRAHELEEFDSRTLYKPFATALRMGNLGYKSEAQQSLFVCYNDLSNYLDSLQQALSTPYPPYQKIGLKKDEHYLQINTNLLQLENEFYGTIRPKRVGQSGERPLNLLRESGIQYIEVRILDLNPYLPVGLDAEQMRFLDAFLLHCLLSESPLCTRESNAEIESNLARVVNEGRRPGLVLSRDGKEVAFTDWAGQLLRDIEHAARLLDAIHRTELYSQACAAQQAKVADPALTPSARLLADMRQAGRPFCGFTMSQAMATEQYFRSQSLPEETLQEFQRISRQSLQEQADMEAADTVDFDTFLAQWSTIAE